jgi:hypothetical protein
VVRIALPKWGAIRTTDGVSSAATGDDTTAGVARAPWGQ